MEDRPQMLMNLLLNDQKNLKIYDEQLNAFKPQKKGLKLVNQKQILRGIFHNYSSTLKEFKQFYFELYPNLLLRYQDKTKAPPVDYLLCQYYSISEWQEVIGEQVAFGIDLQGEDGIAKLVTDKFQIYKTWLKYLKKFCKLNNFSTRYKVENKIYEHFYRCVDKKKKIYTAVKIINKKGLKFEQRKFVENEIMIIRKLTCPILPPLKKIYEDQNYIYMTFLYFKGEDLMNIASNSKLEEIAVATLAYHILKGLKVLHMNGYFHGNLKLENIIFSTNKKDNEIFLINFKYFEESTQSYREKLIKKGNNFYVAPELLEDQSFDNKIDIFSLGVCLFYMVFKRFPYTQVEKDQFSNVFKYNLDLSLLDDMKIEKKKNPSSKQALSASGIDFFLNLLSTDPANRPTASQAMNHSWFINFTSKQGKIKNKQRYQQSPDFDMLSLRTIIESSEVSERDINMDSRIIYSNINNGITQQVPEEEHEYSDNSSSDLDEVIDDDEGGGLVHLMQTLELNSQTMAPSKESKMSMRDSATCLSHKQIKTQSSYNMIGTRQKSQSLGNANILEELKEDD